MSSRFCDLAFDSDEDAFYPESAEDDADQDVSEDEQLSQLDRAALLKDAAPMFDSIKSQIERLEPELVGAYKLTGRNFDSWSISTHGRTLEALFDLHGLMQQLEKAILYGDEISIGMARRRLQEQSQAVFAEAERLIADMVIKSRAA